jgi:hypothetical protein
MKQSSWGTHVAPQKNPSASGDRLAELYLSLFGSGTGQEVFDDLRSQAEHPHFDETKPLDPHMLSYKEGKRAIVRHIFARVEAAKRRREKGE